MQSVVFKNDIMGPGITTTLAKKVVFESKSNSNRYDFRIVYNEMDNSTREIRHTEVKKSQGTSKLRCTADGEYILYTNRGELKYNLGIDDRNQLSVIENENMIPVGVNQKAIENIANELEERRREGLILLNQLKNERDSSLKW